MKIKIEAEGGDCRDRMARMALDMLDDDFRVTEVRLKHNGKKYKFKKSYSLQTCQELYPEIEFVESA